MVSSRQERRLDYTGVLQASITTSYILFNKKFRSHKDKVPAGYVHLNVTCKLLLLLLS